MSTGKQKVTTIFLADDDESVRRELREFFAGCPGYRVVGEAPNGAEAVERCRHLTPDVALLDIQMPVLDGLGAARLLLREELVRCVVMLTAFDDRPYIQAALDAGAFGYLTKPFEPGRILPTLELCIHQSREHHLLVKERQKLERREQERDLVDRAKLILMEDRGLTEDEAYRYIKELSLRKCMSMARVSRYIIARTEGDA